jgi:DNA polymerase I-like protein with 3'-5' exonuclease and polymerase domains
VPEEENELADFLDSLREQPPAETASAVSTMSLETADDDLTDFLDSPSLVVESVSPPPPAPIAIDALASDDDDLSDFFEGSGIRVSSKDSKLIKPWMKFHQFKLVRTIEGVRELVDLALAHGRCGLDLETEGFDNRVNYAPDGTKSTVHKIVGYCISVRGVGHYIPVRHRFNPLYGEKDPNAPLVETESEIRRLCLASQPELTEEGRRDDPLASTKIVGGKPKMLIYFWNAKFDQEFLFPITGIDFWHPDSFEDGMLAAYSVYSDDPSLGLKSKAQSRLTVHDPSQVVDGKPSPLKYEMIEFAELFPAKMSSKDRKFYDLYPEEGTPVVLYACSDAICTEALCERNKKTPWELTVPDIKTDYQNVVEEAYEQRYYFTYRLEKQAAQAVRDMERKRAKIDKQEILVLLKKAGEELAKYEDLIKALAKNNGFDNFNPGSPQQLSNFLFEQDGLNISPKPEKNIASGFYKTDAATLEHMAEAADAPAVLGWIVKYRQIDKIIGTYLTSMSENCDSEDQLRFKFNQTGATTGRFTAPAGEPDHGYAGIPIQGIPARDDPKKPEVAHSLRRIFVARTGYTLVKVDYAGQELRIVANLSGEPKWVDEFVKARSEGREADLHTLTAKAFFGEHITKDNKVERNMGKIANFSLIYGGGSSAIMRATKCDKVEAVRRKANFDKSVPVFAGWVKGQHAGVKKNKGVVTAFRRFIAIPDANVKAGELDANGTVVTPEDARKIQASCERKSTNFPIQGSGADILKISLVKLVKEFYRRGWNRENGDDSVRMIMTVHDEIVFEIKHERLTQAMPIIIEAMESPWKMAKWRIPLVVEPLIGLTWDAKIDWHKMMTGKEPVPAWLEGIIQPGELHPEPSGQDPDQTVRSAPSPIASLPKERAVNVQTPTVKRDSAPPSSTKGTRKVATFALASTFLTNRIVEVVFEALAGALDPDNAIFFRLVDNVGVVLFDPSQHRVPISPERLKLRFQDRNLGSGEYELREEPL